MPSYTVDFTTTASVTVKVEADDPDSAIDFAYDEMPAEICAQCSGWGRNWSKEEGEYEVDAVYGADGKKVWGDTTEGTT